ncbi:MAG: hypothetical protein ABIK44_04560 [candidate division WOR-3 bacterium]
MNLLIVLVIGGSITLKPEFGIGADYSSQRYSTYSLDTLPADTSAIETEGRSFLGLALNLSSNPTELAGKNTFHVSTSSIRNHLNLDLNQRLSALFRLEADFQTELRHYHKALPVLADTAFRRDYWNSSGSIDLRLEPSERFNIALGDAAEYQRYFQPDSFSYNYLRNRIRTSLSVRPGLLTTVDAGYDLSNCRAQNSDSNSYLDHAIRVGIDRFLDPGWQLRLGAGLTRRRYPSPSRSYREINPEGSIRRDLGAAAAVALDDCSRITWFDSPVDIYRNEFENRLALVLELRPTPPLSFRLGPEHQFSRSLDSPSSTDYTEFAFLGGLDVMQPGRIWLSIEDRLGSRTYPQAESSFSSSYRFNELNISGNMTIVPGLTLDAFIAIAPEWHADKTENLAGLTFSLELTYRP